MKVLAECLPRVGHFVLDLRCDVCGDPLPLTAAVEEYRTTASRWIVAECPHCRVWTPLQLEKKSA